jgi:hypothetical protein
MARVEIRVSDLTREPIEDDSRAARLIVEHPDYPEPVGLDVLADEVEPYLSDEGTRFVVVFLEDPDNPNPKRHFMTIEEFDELFQTGDSQSALEDAFSTQQEEQRSRRRGGRKAASRQQPQTRRRERIDYASPEHAGEPHRGTVSEAEAAYVRENLDEVNARLDREGYRTIDPNDPEIAARYRFEPPVGRDEVEERIEDEGPPA